MTREDLKKIIEGITDEQLKSILDINSADIGKAKKDYEDVKAENDTLKSDKKSLEERITELSDKSNTANDYKKQLDDLKKEIKDKEDAEKLEAEDKALTDAIVKAFGEKKFSSDYVRDGIIRDMKTEIAKPENKGKGYDELFNILTKDKEGIFANSNPPGDMTGMGDFGAKSVSENTMRAVMGLSPNNKE